MVGQGEQTNGTTSELQESNGLQQSTVVMHTQTLEMTPDKPDESDKPPPPLFRSILVPVIADLNKFHPTNYVSKRANKRQNTNHM